MRWYFHEWGIKTGACIWGSLSWFLLLYSGRRQASFWNGPNDERLILANSHKNWSPQMRAKLLQDLTWLHVLEANTPRLPLGMSWYYSSLMIKLLILKLKAFLCISKIPYSLSYWNLNRKHGGDYVPVAVLRTADT